MANQLLDDDGMSKLLSEVKKYTDSLYENLDTNLNKTINSVYRHLDEKFYDLNYKDEIDDPKQLLKYNIELGRYDNSSIQNYLDYFQDGLIYGVIVHEGYDGREANTCIKFGANEGLKITQSVQNTPGTSDYENKKLFMCPRVNGGVDSDGMPYVTAIEGIDDRFDSTKYDTWALTPLYYYKYTYDFELYESENKIDIIKEFSDSYFEGSNIVVGAYTTEGRLRPYILRACYPCEIDNKRSISGVNFEYSYVLNSSNIDNLSNDLYGCLKPFDSTYVLDFIHLMVGIRSIYSLRPYTAENSQHTGDLDFVPGSFGKYGWLNGFKFQNIELLTFCEFYDGFYFYNDSENNEKYYKLYMNTIYDEYYKIDANRLDTSLCSSISGNISSTFSGIITNINYMYGVCAPYNFLNMKLYDRYGYGTTGSLDFSSGNTVFDKYDLPVYTGELNINTYVPTINNLYPITRLSALSNTKYVEIDGPVY